ncbi:sulphite reductase hemo protein, beta subunit [Wallemia mellicola]|uniref:assimilatory sulfite reductase (NADPH) n=1 Tax=Wallemia mellicola TaxID=1708541 RepID=A0A4V6TQX4_9BASI|nr:sulphite reductase hemo protein, beta subunit [Wallemia mellicola]TIC13313.1 sulphite reductase hemo protein, beta subunit [Wallemia mellicola]TIC63104.1 sulphite reductase hemo protein, beta subunit [Wallemia mellicola]
MSKSAAKPSNNDKKRKSNEIDDIFSGASTSTSSKDKTSTDKTTSSKKKAKKVKKNAESNDKEEKNDKSEPSAAPITVVDTTSSKPEKPEKVEKKKEKKQKANEEDDFADSRGTSGRKKTEDGYSVYTFDELKMNDDIGGDTPLCPFDCDCCSIGSRGMSTLTSQVVGRIAYLSSKTLVSVLPPSHEPSSFSQTYDVLQSDTGLFNHPNIATLHTRAQPVDTAFRQSLNGANPVTVTAKADPTLINEIITLTQDLNNEPIIFNLSIEQAGDLSDILTLRSSGLPIIYSSTVTEAHDHALIAAKLAVQLNSSVIHVFEDSPIDGFSEISQEDLKNFLQNEKAAQNGVHANGVAHLPSNKSAKQLDKFDAIALQALIATRRPQRTSFYTGPSDPKTILIIFGSASAAFLNFVNKDSEFGVLALSTYRPLDYQRLLDLIPASVERVAVLEQVTKKVDQFAPLFVDVISAFSTSDRELPKLLSGVIGSVSQDKSGLIAESVLTNLSKDQPEHGQLYGKLSETAQANYDVYVPKHEKSYTQLLEQIFGENLAVVNSPDQVPSEGIDITSPEFAFGSTVANLSKRETVINAISELIASKNSVSDELHAAFSKWLLKKDDTKTSQALANKAIEILKNEKPSHPKVPYILQNTALLTSQSRWIIGSDAWSHDAGFSGLHHVISSGKNINVLLIDSLPYHQRNAQDPSKRKKDVGLYAMNYGDVYVASVAVYSSYTQVLQALIEADKYDGPSIVLAYLPYTSEQSTPLEMLKDTKAAVDVGYWPLYRWNPARETNEIFSLDSERIKSDLKDFLDRQNHLANYVQAKPQLAPQLVGSEGQGLKDAQKRKAQQALDSLLGNMDGPPLLILFASDGGNAEKLAKRIGVRAKLRGVAARALAMDDFPLEDIKLEKNVVFVTSTAGQGEPPQNGRNFFKTTATLLGQPDASKTFSDVKFSVFGMGDSHYWPRAEDAHFYNRPGKDLDERFEKLGGIRFADLGLGDDQDPDGPQTGYKIWEPKLWKALGVDDVEVTEKEPEPVTNEHIKIASNYLRGTIEQGLADESTGAIAEADTQLTKFHGTYMQDDRDIREDRKNEGLEPAYSFMIRVRMPAGVCDGPQWLAFDRIGDEYANKSMKITTRQTFQFHGVIKRNLKATMQAINKTTLDTIAACGDVNRNVLASTNPTFSHLHATVHEVAKGLSDHLLPQTSAYREIWLDGKKVAGESVVDHEPLYGPYYLPRKFKIAVAIPPHNDVDVFANDVGFIAIVNEKTRQLDGFNVSIGGGMGVTHSNKKTYPRLGDVIGFVPPNKVNDVAEKIMLVQRDYGNRENRKNARLKYTIDRLSLTGFVDKLHEYLGYKLEETRPYKFDSNIDKYGWAQGEDGKWHFTMFVENGRIQDEIDGIQYKTGLREVAKIHKGKFRLTANQHLIISDVEESQLETIKNLLHKYKLDVLTYTGLRLSSSACVALPTCGLAMAESERYLPMLVGKVEKIMEKNGLRNDMIVMRMSGCPNGCSRPWMGEIAFVGRAPGTYLMLLGGASDGTRLAKPFKESVTEPEILDILNPLIKNYALERLENESFGDFVIRQGVIKATTHGTNFYDNSCL